MNQNTYDQNQYYFSRDETGKKTVLKSWQKKAGKSFAHSPLPEGICTKLLLWQCSQK